MKAKSKHSSEISKSEKGSRVGIPEPKQLSFAGQAQFSGDRLLAACLSYVFLVEIVGNFEIAAFYSYRMLGLLISLGFVHALVSKVDSLLAALLRSLFLVGLGAFVCFLSRSAFPEREVLFRLHERAKFDRRVGSEVIRDRFAFRAISPIEHTGSFRLRFRAALNKQGLELGEVLVDAPDVPWSRLSEAGEGFSGEANFRLKLLATEPDSLPPPFSYEAYLFRRGLVASARLEELFRLEDHSPESRWRRFMLRLLSDFRPSAELGVILASTLGEDDLLDEHTKDLFRNTGLTHVLVVSGYQVGVVFLLVYSLLRRICSRSVSIISRIALESVTALLSLFLANGYAILTGGAVSAERALMTLALIAFGRMLGRKAHLWRSFACILLISILRWPGAIFEAGFELMFAALLGLMAANVFAEKLERQAHWYKWVAELCCVSLFPTIFTTPICILWFQLWVPAAALFNLLFALLMSIICTSYSGVALVTVYLDLPGGKLFLESGMFLTKSILDALEFLEDLLRSYGLCAQYLEGTALGAALCLSSVLAFSAAFFSFILPRLPFRFERVTIPKCAEITNEIELEESFLPKSDFYGRTAPNSR